MYSQANDDYSISYSYENKPCPNGTKELSTVPHALKIMRNAFTGDLMRIIRQSSFKKSDVYKSTTY